MLLKLIATPLQLFLTAGHYADSGHTFWSTCNVTNMISIIIIKSIHNVTSSCKGAMTQLYHIKSTELASCTEYYAFIKFYLVRYCKLCCGIAIQETRIPSEMCVGNMYHWWNTRIPSDICVGTHASLGIHMWDTLYPGKHASLWQQYSKSNWIILFLNL